MGPSDQGRSYRGDELGINCFREAIERIRRRLHDVRFVPKADKVRRNKKVAYSITSSARNNKDVATSTPMVFVVFKFTMV